MWVQGVVGQVLLDWNSLKVTRYRETTSSSRRSWTEFGWRLESVEGENRCLLCLFSYFYLGILFFGHCWKPSTLLGRPPISTGYLFMCPPFHVSQEWWRRGSHTVTEWEAGRSGFVDNWFYWFAKTMRYWISSLISYKALFLFSCWIKQDCMGSLQAVLEQKLRFSRLESCIFTDHGFQYGSPICEVRLKSKWDEKPRLLFFLISYYTAD